MFVTDTLRVYQLFLKYMRDFTIEIISKVQFRISTMYPYEKTYKQIQQNTNNQYHWNIHLYCMFCKLLNNKTYFVKLM